MNIADIRPGDEFVITDLVAVIFTDVMVDGFRYSPGVVLVAADPPTQKRPLGFVDLRADLGGGKIGLIDLMFLDRRAAAPATSVSDAGATPDGRHVTHADMLNLKPGDRLEVKMSPQFIYRRIFTDGEEIIVGSPAVFGIDTDRPLIRIDDSRLERGWGFVPHYDVRVPGRQTSTEHFSGG